MNLLGMEHAVFGQLEYDEDTSCWKCVLPIPACLSRANGEQVFYLAITAPDLEPPSDAAVELWADLQSRPAEFSGFLEQAIFAAYQRDLPHYQSTMGAEALALAVPDLTRAELVWQYVGLHDHLIRPVADGEAQLLIGLTAAWRREWGMDLVFRKDQLGVGEGHTVWEELLHFELPAQPTRV